MTTTIDDIFEGCRGFDEIMMVILDLDGLEGLEVYLEHATTFPTLERKYLLQAIDAFKAVGLSEAVAMMMDYLPKAPEALPIPALCPYSDENLHPIHRQYWMSNFKEFGPTDVDYLRRNDPEMLKYLQGKAR